MESASSGSPLRRLTAAVLLTTLAVSCVAVLAACGGDDGGGDVEGLLDRGFRTAVRSADVKIDAQFSVDGLRGFERPVRLQASGAYVGGRQSLPKLDIDVTIGAQGAGQTVQSGLLSTGDRAFVKFGGEFYEQARADVSRANRELRRDRGGRRGSLRDLGLDPRRWVVGARDEGVANVGGVETRHISGKLDSGSLFRDLNRVVERSAEVVGGKRPDVPDPLSGDEIDRLAQIVRSPSFDVYIGEDDDIVRRVSASLDVKVPEAERARLGGIEAGSLRFSVELANVNGDQAVHAPLKSRPIADLTKQLGGLGALAGTPAAPGASSGRAGGSAPGSAATPEVEALRRYSDCVDRASPNDTKALSHCRELVR